MIYLDYAANTPVDPEVLNCFCETAAQYPGNPNSAHPAGTAARRELERITDGIAELLSAAPEEVIFTSGAAESNNLAVKGIAEAYRNNGRHIITTPLEHPSTADSLAYLQEQGWEVDTLHLTADGSIDLKELSALLRPDTVLLTISLADSELGIIQPLSAIQSLLTVYPACHLHVDATQALGWVPVTFAGMDTMSFAPHKFGGLAGTGILMKRRGLRLTPQIHGGGMQTLRSGTPSLALAASTETALRKALAEEPSRTARVRALNHRLRSALAVYPRAEINSPADAVPDILNLSVTGISGPSFQRMLAERGFCVSVRSACETAGAPSAAVLAVSGDRRRALSSWRISLGADTTEEEIDHFLACFAQILKGLPV